MSKRKFDIDIGHRMAEECYRIFGTQRNTAKILQCDRKNVYYWETLGLVPSLGFVIRLHHFGGDVMYVLFGKRGGQNV